MLDAKTLPENLQTAIGDTPYHVIATKYGLSPVTLSRIINGHIVPRQIRVLKALKRILKNGGVNT